MNLSSYIAKRYFVSRKKKNFINWLSYISIAIVAVCCAALIIVLSFFNGLGDLLRSLNNAFDPEIKIEVIKGKSFEYSDELKNAVNAVEGVELVTEVIEDYAYVKYQGAEMVVTMKGVSEDFMTDNRLENSIVHGEYKLMENNTPYAIVGEGVQFYLHIQPGNEMNALQIHYIKDVKPGRLNPAELYSKRSILPSSVFSIEKSIDENYILVPLEFARDLLDYGMKRTALEIKTSKEHSPYDVQEKLREALGEGFTVLNAEEQHADLFKLLKMEKLFTFLSLVLILGVGSINIFFVLSMLALEKKKDISILFSMGASASLIRNIFIKEGMLIAGFGAVAGLLTGALVCWLQGTVGLISMGMATAVQNYYPVRMAWPDFIYIALSIITLTLLISFRPATLATRYHSIEEL